MTKIFLYWPTISNLPSPSNISFKSSVSTPTDNTTIFNEVPGKNPISVFKSDTSSKIITINNPDNGTTPPPSYSSRKY